MEPGRYILSRDTFSVGGDYTVVDHAGATVLTFDGKLRFAATFAVLAPDGRQLFTGKEHVLSLDRRFEFERDGYVHTIDLVDGTDGAFVMAVVMAVARLNPPSGVGSPAD